MDHDPTFSLTLAAAACSFVIIGTARSHRALRVAGVCTLAALAVYLLKPRQLDESRSRCTVGAHPHANDTCRPLRVRLQGYHTTAALHAAPLKEVWLRAGFTETRSEDCANRESNLAPPFIV